MTRFSKDTGGAMTMDPRAAETGGVCIGRRYEGGGTGVVSLSGLASTPNLQLPIPKGSRSNNGMKNLQPAISATLTHLFERLPLGVGSWELEVDERSKTV